MMRFLSSLFGGSNRVLPPFDYTRQMAEALRRASPGRNVEMITLLELKVQRQAPWVEVDHFPSLHDAYERYREAAEPEDYLLQEAAQEITQTLRLAEADLLDRSRILPLLVSPSFEEHVRQRNEGQRRNPSFHPVQETFNPELNLYYMVREDDERSYLLEKTYLPEDMDLASLREPAMANLRNRLASVTREAVDGIWRFSAVQGDVASLSLLDHPIWSEVQAETTGEVVVAVPVRGRLMAADSAKAKGLEHLRRLAAKAHAEDGILPLNLLSPRLFVRREGKLEIFE